MQSLQSGKLLSLKGPYKGDGIPRRAVAMATHHLKYRCFAIGGSISDL